jgi:prophage regulatory protein
MSEKVPPPSLQRLLREPEVLRLIPFSRTTLWRQVRRGLFPRPLKLSSGVSAWSANEIATWIATRDRVSLPPDASEVRDEKV